ncbi:hypothetical protein QUV94_03805 [Collinsella intestinalis]|nr:hypothetical protein [Collinsella intestinalis]
MAQLDLGDALYTSGGDVLGCGPVALRADEVACLLRGQEQEGDGAHVAEGATLVHDRERAHGVLVRENGLVDESYKADVRDTAYLEAMALVNNLCSWIKRYLWRFTGMDPKNP